MNGITFLQVEDLDVYRKLCQLHIEICDQTHRWPSEEKFELGSQIRRRKVEEAPAAYDTSCPSGWPVPSLPTPSSHPDTRLQTPGTPSPPATNLPA